MMYDAVKYRMESSLDTGLFVFSLGRLCSGCVGSIAVERILYPTIIDLLIPIPAKYKLAIILSYYT